MVGRHHAVGIRLYETKAVELVKPHAFVLVFVGMFDKLKKRSHLNAE
jgi:hypothetical protein